jgi:hypothetical protein
MKTILFDCSCGLPLVAIVFHEEKTGDKVRFYTREPRRRIAECPNCQRDFSRVTAEEFLEKVWQG